MLAVDCPGSEKVCSFGRRVVVLLTVGGLLATGTAFGDTLQSRSDIGIGWVPGGLGSGPGPGTYDVYLYVRTHKRFAVYADDGGHEEYYCRTPDLPASQCGWSVHVDGIKLREEKIENDSGLFAGTRFLYNIEGSLNSFEDRSKWEWPSEGWIDHYNLPSSVRWTHRNRTLASLKFRVNWNGTKISSRVRAKWFESDPGPWPFVADDHSEWAYFNTGDMITKCLQGGSEGQTRDLLSPNANYYWHLCSEDGICLESFVNEGLLGLHYNIATYYYVRCVWDRPAVCGNGSCESGETWSSCSLDCPRAYTCGDGTCEWEWGETTLNCYQDCGPQVEDF